MTEANEEDEVKKKSKFEPEALALKHTLNMPCYAEVRRFGGNIEAVQWYPIVCVKVRQLRHYVDAMARVLPPFAKPSQIAVCLHPPPARMCFGKNLKNSH
jgi:hypothetical protein